MLSKYKSIFILHKQVKINNRKETRFGELVTPFSSSSALR